MIFPSAGYTIGFYRYPAGLQHILQEYKEFLEKKSNPKEIRKCVLQYECINIGYPIVLHH